MPWRSVYEVLTIRSRDGRCYLIPRDVVHQGLLSATQRAEATLLIDEGNLVGFSGGVLLPYTDQQGHYYALAVELIEQYRVPDEGLVEANAILGEETSGYGWDESCPAGTRALEFWHGCFGCFPPLPGQIRP
jgi:hypothetical protein